MCIIRDCGAYWWEIVVLMGARHMALEVMKKAESGLLSKELHPQIYELLVKNISPTYICFLSLCVL